MLHNICKVYGFSRNISCITNHKSPSGIGISVVVDMVVVVIASTAVSSVAVVFSSGMQHNAGG